MSGVEMPTSAFQMPGPLRMVLEDLHQLWCDDDDESHLTDPDPAYASLALSEAMLELEWCGCDGCRSVLGGLADALQQAVPHYLDSRGYDEVDDAKALDLDALDLGSDQ